MLSNASMGAVVTTAMPFFTVILARIFFHKKLSLRKYLSILVATLGVFVIVSNNLIQGQSLKGICMFLISSFCLAIASLLFEKTSNFYDNLQITIISIFSSLCILTPWTIFHWNVFYGVNFLAPKIVFSLFFIGCLSTAVAYLLWNTGMKLTSADTAGMFYLLQPIVGTLLGWILLGESVSIGFAIGTICIIGSVIIYLKDRPRIRTK